MIVVTASKNFIEGLLESANMTIQDLSRKAEMSYSQTYDIVKNGISLGTRVGNIEKLAEVLGVTVLDILERHPRKD